MTEKEWRRRFVESSYVLLLRLLKWNVYMHLFPAVLIIFCLRSERKFGTTSKAQHEIIYLKLLPTLQKRIKIIQFFIRRLIVNIKLNDEYCQRGYQVSTLSSSRLNDALLNSCDKGVSFWKSFLACLKFLNEE